MLDSVVDALTGPAPAAGPGQLRARPGRGGRAGRAGHGVVSDGGGAGHQPRAAGRGRRAGVGGAVARPPRWRAWSCSAIGPRRPTPRSRRREADLAVVAEICERLDGIPLAIELAAARVRSMTPADLAGRLDDRFRLLRGGRRSGLERHQTLRATVQWSYQLLTDEERLLFDRLAVFAGGFDVAGAEAVCADDRVDPLDVGDLLAALVDKSMVVADRHGTHARYRLLETLRQYGEERLAEGGELDALRDRHLDHYVAVAREASRRPKAPATTTAAHPRSRVGQLPSRHAVGDHTARSRLGNPDPARLVLLLVDRRARRTGALGRGAPRHPWRQVEHLRDSRLLRCRWG